MPLACLVGFAIALWPHWRWAAARLVDGSDEPLGLAALVVLLIAVTGLVPRLRSEPSPAWLAVAVLLTAGSTVLGAVAPALVGALVAALALVAVLAAFMPAGAPVAPLAGLAALALPIVSSLQFYAGFPLRVVTAEASMRLLGLLGFDASREGSAMLVDGRLIIVDAPCSGVQMAWLAYFCACTVACWRGLPDRAFVRRLAWVGVVVLGGNVVRNSILVALDATVTTTVAIVHEAVGLGVLGAVCALVAWLVGRGPVAGTAVASTIPWPGVPLRNRLVAAIAALLLACGLAPLLQAGRGLDIASPARAPAPAPSEWPRQWQGRPLRPLALGAVEARFAAHFPGRIERLTDDESVLIWREVRAPTRMLHPATDCYRGLGYSIADARLERAAGGKLWRCFVAAREGRSVRVCERIEGAGGDSFTDASAWFWAAELGHSGGPWQAITVATPLGGAT